MLVEKWVVMHVKSWWHHPKIKTVAVANWLHQSSSAATFKHRRLDSFTMWWGAPDFHSAFISINIIFCSYWSFMTIHHFLKVFTHILFSAPSTWVFSQRNFVHTVMFHISNWFFKLCFSKAFPALQVLGMVPHMKWKCNRIVCPQHSEE